MDIMVRFTRPGGDQIGLTEGLTFGDLTIGENGTGEATLQVTGGEFLATLSGVAPGDLDAINFIVD